MSMEIKFSHISNDLVQDLSFTIPSGVITGITGSGKEEVLKIIAGRSKSKGIVYYDKVRRTKKNEAFFYRQIAYVPLELKKEFPLSKIEEYFRMYLSYYAIKTTDIDKKIKNAMKVVGLDEGILKKSFSAVSKSEEKLLQLSLAFLSNPKVLVLEDPFVFFDLKNQQKVAHILEKLKDKFHKTIVIASDNPDLLYQHTKYLIVLENNTILLEGMTENVYYYQSEVVKSNIFLPEIVSFIKYVEKEKGVKLDHRKDVKDVMKDIYRNIY